MALILDRNCFRGRSQDEVGIIAIVRRHILKMGYSMRVFNFYDWKKLDRRHLKITYCQQKLKKIKQNEEFLKKKYHFTMTS